MRNAKVWWIGLLAFVALAEPLYAPPVRVPRTHSVPHEVKRPSHDATSSSARERTISGDHTTTRYEEFRSRDYPSGSSRDDEPAEPFIFCALPTGAAFEKVFGGTFTAAKESEMRENENTARSIRGGRYEVNHEFRRAELLAAIADHRGKRPFLLVCHSEGSNENRDIPLADGTISENELRSVCDRNGTELFLISCRSKDLGISKDISYGEAFRIVKLATDGLDFTTMTVAQLKAALVEAAQKNLKRDVELRISYGADVKKVVTVTGGSGAGEDDDGLPWIVIIIGVVIAIGVVRRVYRAANNRR